MKRLISAQLRIWFWSVYGRFLWDEQKIVPPQVQQIVTMLKAQTGGIYTRVLDVGCGTGVYALALAQADFDVTGIDAASGMLARAYPKASAPHVSHLRFQQMDLDHCLAFPDQQFDCAIAISVLQSVTNPARTLGGLWRVLKSGGVLVVLHVPKPPYHHLPLLEEVRQRASHLKRKTARNIALLAVKSWAERAGATRYWTVAELHAMLEAQQYHIQYTDAGPPIIIVAQKPSA